VVTQRIPPKPKAVLFDMGGVLLDPVDRWDAEQFPISFPEGLPEPAPRDWFLAMSQEIIAAFLAIPAPRPTFNVRPYIAAWLRKRNVELTPEVVDHWHDILAQWEASPVYDFARPSLDAVRAMGFRTGLVSNTLMPAIHIRRRLREAGVLDLFECTVFSAEFGTGKPHPSIFRHALDTLGVRPEDAWYVGDKPQRDVCGAHGVGMFAVLVDGPEVKHVDDGPEYVPDLRIRDISVLPEVLRRAR
jgi:HAD superfamily hydrolase (TIGR01549 family)